MRAEAEAEGTRPISRARWQKEAEVVGPDDEGLIHEDLLARVAPVAVDVEVEPRVQSARAGRGHPDVNGVADDQRIEETHAVFVVDAVDVITLRGGGGKPVDLHVHIGAQVEAGGQIVHRTVVRERGGIAAGQAGLGGVGRVAEVVGAEVAEVDVLLDLPGVHHDRMRRGRHHVVAAERADGVGERKGSLQIADAVEHVDVGPRRVAEQKISVHHRHAIVLRASARAEDVGDQAGGGIDLGNVAGRVVGGHQGARTDDAGQAARQG